MGSNLKMWNGFGLQFLAAEEWFVCLGTLAVQMDMVKSFLMFVLQAYSQELSIFGQKKAHSPKWVLVLKVYYELSVLPFLHNH